MDTTRRAALAAAVALAALAGYAAVSKPAPQVPPKKAAPKATPPPPDCPDGKCTPKKPRPKPWGERPPAPVGASLVWSKWDGTREYALMDGTRQLGSYDAEAGVYRACEGDGWGPKTWLPEGIPHPEGEAQGGPVGPGGVEVQCEVPLQFRTRNIGSRVDGAGMCVSTSTIVAASWSGLDGWLGYRDWCAKFRGGSTPPQQLRQLAQYAREKNLPEAPWAQYVGRDPAPFLDAVLGSGRVACVSWMHGGHWLNLVHLDDKHACIMDNNGDPNNLKWMSRAAALREINSPYSWVGCWLPPGPPPAPKNAGTPKAQGFAARTPQALPAWSACGEKGVFLDNLVGADELTIRGRPGTIDELRAALGTGKGNRLTVIGTPEQAPPAGLIDALGKAGVPVAFYPPDAWQVRGLGFAPGSPSIYLQAADGTVLHRRDEIGDPETLLEAIRKADPNYDPKLDPTPHAPDAPGGGANDPAPLVALAGAAGVAAWLASRRK